MNQAVFCVTPTSRARVVLATPFLCEVSSQIAINHFRIGTLLSSKMVPTLMENRFAQPLAAHLCVFLSAKV